MCRLSHQLCITLCLGKGTNAGCANFGLTLRIVALGVKMKKKYKILLVILFILCLIPIPTFYKDGGTVTYSAIFYKIIKWNRLDGKQGTELHIFPTNFHSIDYYDK